MEENFFTQIVFNSLEDFIALFTDEQYINMILNIVYIIIAVLWAYCGFRLYSDARRRFKMNVALKMLVLFVGIILGPIGLFLYTLVRPKFTTDEIDFLKVEHKFYYQQASKVIECMNCGEYLLEGHEFCTNCGEQNRLKCQNCNNLTNLHDKFCYYCGFKFDTNERMNLLAQRDHEANTIRIESSDRNNVPNLTATGIIQGEEKEPFILIFGKTSESLKKFVNGLSDVSNNLTNSVKGFISNQIDTPIESVQSSIVSDNIVVQTIENTPQVTEIENNKTNKSPKKTKLKKSKKKK